MVKTRRELWDEYIRLEERFKMLKYLFQNELPENSEIIEDEWQKQNFDFATDARLLYRGATEYLKNRKKRDD